ncbi:unnamed protein product, partial [Amoebophrya sp. A120]
VQQHVGGGNYNGLTTTFGAPQCKSKQLSTADARFLYIQSSSVARYLSASSSNDAASVGSAADVEKYLRREYRLVENARTLLRRLLSAGVGTSSSSSGASTSTAVVPRPSEDEGGVCLMRIPKPSPVHHYFCVAGRRHRPAMVPEQMSMPEPEPEELAAVHDEVGTSTSSPLPTNEGPTSGQGLVTTDGASGRDDDDLQWCAAQDLDSFKYTQGYNAGFALPPLEGARQEEQHDEAATLLSFTASHDMAAPAEGRTSCHCLQKLAFEPAHYLWRPYRASAAELDLEFRGMTRAGEEDGKGEQWCLEQQKRGGSHPNYVLLYRNANVEIQGFPLWRGEAHERAGGQERDPRLSFPSTGSICLKRVRQRRVSDVQGVDFRVVTATSSVPHAEEHRSDQPEVDPEPASGSAAPGEN